MYGIQTIVVCAAGAAIAAVSLAVFDPALAAISTLLGWAMLAIAFSDARRFVVPDVISLPAIPAGMMAAWGFAGPGIRDGALLWHFLAAAVAAATFYAIRAGYGAIRRREGLGLGDVKLAGVAGAWCGLAGLPYVLLLACLAALLATGLASLRGARLGAASVIPFGTFLGPAIWLVWAAGKVFEAAP